MRRCDRVGEDLVRLLELAELEAVRDERVGSSLPSTISWSRRGVVLVSTRPVVIVTSLIHSVSRWSVAG